MGRLVSARRRSFGEEQTLALEILDNSYGVPFVDSGQKISPANSQNLVYMIRKSSIDAFMIVLTCSHHH